MLAAAGSESPQFRRPDARLAVVADRLSQPGYHGLPVVEQDSRYAGMVSLGEVLLASRTPLLDSTIIAADLMRSDVPPLRPEDRLDQALELFARGDRLVLPVVDGTPARRVIGPVGRADISRAYLQQVHGSAGSRGAEENAPGYTGP